MSAGDVVRALYESLLKGDVPGFLARLDPDVIVNEPAELPYGGVHLGRDAFVQSVLGVITGHADIEITEATVIDNEAGLVGLLAGTLTAHSTGERFPLANVELYQVVGETIRKIDVYAKDPAALAAFYARVGASADAGTSMAKPAILDRMERAMSSQDASQVAACFTADYRCEMPLDPSRGFIGREQVLRNWTALFARVRDHKARVLRWAVDADSTWSEWDMTGITADGTPHRAGGVAVLTVEGNRVAAARSYLDLVTDLEGGPAAASRSRQHRAVAVRNSLSVRRTTSSNSSSLAASIQRS